MAPFTERQIIIMNNLQKLLTVLKQSDTPLSSRQLSSLLSVSDRSVRNYIKELRNAGEQITANENGYLWIGIKNDEPESPGNKSQALFAFATPEERINYIIERLILAKSGLDLYDLADSIYISYSTIEKDMIRVKKKLALFNLSIHRQNGTIDIVGEEHHKRALFSHYLTSNLDSTMDLTLESFCKLLNISPDSLRAIVHEALQTENLYASDYAFKSIIIHVIINMTRIKIRECLLEKPLYDSVTIHTAEYRAASRIFDQISRLCPIQFNENELQQLAFIIMTKTSAINVNNVIDLPRIVDSALIQFVNEIIKQVKTIYYIDLYDTDFINFFTVHLSNALFRCRHNVSIRTPLSDEIFIQNPLIYEIAVFIAQEIKTTFGYELNKDEITFISLHVGAVLGKKMDEHPEIKAVLVVNNYYNYYNKHSLESITQKLSGKCKIAEVTNTLDDVNPAYYDLIIDATNQVLPQANLRVIQTNTIITEHDFKKIQSVCNELLAEKKRRIFHDKLISFMDPQLFEKNHYENSVEDMIRYMAEKLVALGIAPEAFTDSVLEREAVTPTSFDNKVAIPHSIVCSTQKNIGFVIVNEKPLRWGTFDVQIIMMIGVNHQQRMDFKYVYSNLLEHFENSTTVEKLIHASDFHNFIDILTS